MANQVRLIEAVRDGERLDAKAIGDFVAGITRGEVSDTQIAAFAMAVLCRGIAPGALTALTLSMRDSGEVLHWDLGGPVVDKHSTGGIGDCVSLALAPALAALGAYVPMISGRGLGHTGGTLDKMNAIPGVRTDLTAAEFQAQVSEIGAAIIGQTSALAPADKRFYAVRDVTGTVPSIDLITMSILSKKLAAGLGGLVLDVKTGRGAFMQTEAEAEKLAQTLVDTAIAAGCQTSALMTRMDNPLCSAAGNALEVDVILNLLGGEKSETALLEVSCALGGEILAAVGLSESAMAGKVAIAETFADGRAAEKYLAMIRAQGAKATSLDALRNILPKASEIRPVLAQDTGLIAGYHAREIGFAVIDLGGGRKKTDDVLDLGVGFSGLLPAGTRVEKGDSIAFIHAKSETDAERAEQAIRQACLWANAPLAPQNPIIKRITAKEEKNK